MDYRKIYNQIIERAKNRKVEGYTEKHHIIPKCLGGSDIHSNIVELTAREHYICHKILKQLYPTNKKLSYALWLMTNKVSNNIHQRNYIVSNREYERIRESHSKIVSDRWRGRDDQNGKDNAFYGKTHSNKTKKLISEKAKERYKTQLNPRSRKVQCIQHDCCGKRFDTIQDCAEFHNKNRETIYKHCRNRFKSKNFKYI